MSKPVVGLRSKYKKVGSVAAAVLAAVLLTLAQAASFVVLRTLNVFYCLNRKLKVPPARAWEISMEMAYPISFFAKGGIGRCSIASF
jgi:hypothetical protein